jgi:hypothetical protein
VKHNRLIEGEDKKLFKKLKSMPAAGEIIVEVPRNTRDKFPPHKVTLQVKSGSVGIIAPQYLPEKYKDTGTLSLNVIIVEEINPPQKKKPIKWILFTDMEVETLEQAVEKVKWYTHRWKIERFHYVLKSGCKVQDLQFETAERLIKVIALYSIVAWRVLWLVYESRQTPDISCEVVLETREWKVLDCIVNKKRVPRAKAPTLKEATLLIAKYGGFLARKGDGDPGVQVVWEGLRKLSTVMKNFDIINSIQLL